MATLCFLLLDSYRLTVAMDSGIFCKNLDIITYIF